MARGGIGCGSTVIKYILLVFNFIFFISAAIVLGFGIWLLVNPVSLQDVADKASERAGSAGIIPDLPEKTLSAMGYVAAIFGGIIFLISFFGCCGAWKESRILLLVYSVLLGIIFLVLLTIVVGLLVARGKLHGIYADELKKQLKEQYVGPGTNSSNEFTTGWDLVQVELECCGVDSWEEFATAAKWEHEANEQIPVTCCKVSKDNRTDFLDGLITNVTPLDSTCQTAPTTTNANIEKGCSVRLEDELTPKLDKASMQAITVTSVTVIIMACLIAGIVFACCLASSIKSSTVA